MALADYLGVTLTGRAYCRGHAHSVTVKVTGIVGDHLKVESESEFCSQKESSTGWVQPIDSTDPVGESPITGTDESGDIELELDA